MADAQAAPGWYPAGEYGKLRWWDGTQWTEHRAAAPAWLTKQEYRYRQHLLGQAWTFPSMRATVGAMVACLVVPLPLLVMGFVWFVRDDVSLGFEAVATGAFALLAPFWLIDAAAANRRSRVAAEPEPAVTQQRTAPGGEHSQEQPSEHVPVAFPAEVAFLRGRLSPQLGSVLGFTFLAGAVAGALLIYAWHGLASLVAFGLLLLGALGWVVGLTLAMGAFHRSAASRH